MADEIITYEQIEAMYKRKAYKKATDSALARLEKNPGEAKTYLLLAKAYLFRTSPENLDSHSQTILGALELAANNSDTAEEIFNIEGDFLQTISKWKAQWIKGRLGKILEDPTFDNYKLYFPMMPEFPKLHIMAMMTLRRCNKLTQITEAEGVELSDLSKQYSKETTEAITNEEKAELEFNVSSQIFENARTLVESEGDAVGSYVEKVAEIAVERLLVAHLLMGFSIPEKGSDTEIPDEIIAERLKANVELLSYMLGATISPNGRVMSLYQGDREDYVADFDNAVKRIRSIDCTYVSPPRPSNYAIGTSSQNNPSSDSASSSSSSDGCYVATCVYGSYDCPQVWTLRRYRDNTLALNPFGRAFIHLYYAVSPTLVKWFGHTDWFKAMWKGKLDSMVSKLQAKGIEDTPYEDKHW